MNYIEKSDLRSMVMNDAEWCNHLGFSDFEGLNSIIRQGRSIQLVNLCEARHENRFSEIAGRIMEQNSVKLVLLAGPSCSGKTSTSLRVALQCKVHGLNPKTIELDNFFVEREDTPKLPDGQYDYDCLEAMDIQLLNNKLTGLLTGQKVELPRFDFIEGKKKFEGNYMKLEKNDVLILEGIHALNPAMTPAIPEDLKFLIYVSDVSSMSNYDPGMRTTDNRLLRRIVRDSIKRGHNAEETILGWPNVRKGEEQFIFPLQEKANMAFNSTSQYELPLLKHYVTPLLRNIDENSAAFPEAQRMLGFLDKIDPLPIDAISAIPCSSIIREFIGGQILSRDLL